MVIRFIILFHSLRILFFILCIFHFLLLFIGYCRAILSLQQDSERNSSRTDCQSTLPGREPFAFMRF